MYLTGVNDWLACTVSYRQVLASIRHFSGVGEVRYARLIVLLDKGGAREF